MAAVIEARAATQLDAASIDAHARKHLAAYLDDAITLGAHWSESERLELLTSTDHHIVAKRLAKLYDPIDRREAA